MALPPLIQADNITFCYHPGKMALTGASLAIPAGGRVALVGPNGAGKSTLFLHTNGILRPHSGQMRFRGEVYSYSRKALTELRQKVGLVFQDPDTQLFADNVFDDVLFGPSNLGLDKAEARRRAEAALEAVGMLGHGAEPVHYLSEGQKKRVALAGVLAMDPAVLVMDEPTAGLDYPGLVTLRDILADLHSGGKTIVVATHDVDWAWTWADEVYVLAGGRTIAGGPPQAVLSRPDHADLGFARPVIAEIYVGLCGRPPDNPDGFPRTPAELVAKLTEHKNQTG